MVRPEEYVADKVEKALKVESSRERRRNDDVDRIDQEEVRRILVKRWHEADNPKDVK